MSSAKDGCSCCLEKFDKVKETASGLRAIVAKLEHGEIRKEDVIKNLIYAAQVLEENSVLETRRLFEENDDLPEVKADEVPSEIRNWLSDTFTRSSSSVRKGTYNKPKFKSVAQAIRAGIMVDKIFRRVTASALIIPQELQVALKDVNEWSFDIFHFNTLSDNHALTYIAIDLFQRYDSIAKFKINTTYLENFLSYLEMGYSSHGNPYHNLVHAADVTQTMNFMISQCGLMMWMTDLEIFATLFAALIHDFNHSGTTNNYHIQTGSDLALLYNDKAVLENHHISSAFVGLKEEDRNILCHLDRDQYREFRDLCVEMVLSTDMSSHFQQMKQMKSMLSLPDGIDKPKALSVALHCADISHPTKVWNLHQNWTSRLLQEFFKQGDMENEKGLSFSPLCDRSSTLVPQSQIGFIDFIVQPSFQLLSDMLDKIIDSMATTKPSKDHSSKKTKSLLSDNNANESKLEWMPAMKKQKAEKMWFHNLKLNKASWSEKAEKETIANENVSTRM